MKNGIYRKEGYVFFPRTLRFKKMVLSIPLDLKLTSGPIVNANLLLRFLLWLWLWMAIKMVFRCVLY